MEAVLKAHEEAQAARPIYVFDLPPEAQELGDTYIKKSVGFVKLKMHDELDALDIAKNDPTRAVYFMVVKALVEVDGRAIDKGNAEDERILNNTDPMIRSLIVDAHGSLSGPTATGQKDFLKSRRVKVG